jgi:4-hydroxy-tetrahydrodipicolinate synthase
LSIETTWVKRVKEHDSMSRKQIEMRGAMTALVTPMTDEGDLDLAALERLAVWQVEQGIHGLVPCGTTGEGATLDDGEKGEVISTVVRAAGGRVPVVAGVGSNATRSTLEAARVAEGAGADALLVVSPYYNKPNRSGMLAHYEAVARATALPVVVYNVPGRTGQNLGAPLILELAQLPGIVAVKEASGDLDQIASILAGRPEGFAVLSGDDPLALSTMALGAEGVISVVSNEAPGEMARMIDAAAGGDAAAAREIHFRLLPLMRENFAETNPVPVKTAMHLLGHCGATLRAPLGAASDETVSRLRRALELSGLAGVTR